MQRKSVLVGLLLVCLLAFMTARAQAAASQEVWLVRQRVRWTTNDGTRSATTTYESEMRVTVSAGKALDFSIVSGWWWTGDFVAADQVWRDTTVKNHYLVFRAVDLSGTEIAGYFRPNAKWTKLTGKFTGTWTSPAPAESWYCEGTVTATYDHTEP